MLPIVKNPNYDPQMDEIWRHLSTFFMFFEDKKNYENIWEGFVQIVSALVDKNTRQALTYNPQDFITERQESRIQLDFKREDSIPLYIDPSNHNDGFLYKLNKVGFGESYFDENLNETVKVTKIEADFSAINTQSQNITGEIFGILYPESKTAKAYKIQNLTATSVEFVGLDYESIEVTKTMVSFTTGLEFRIDELIFAVPKLYSHINPITDSAVEGIELLFDTDYTFENNIISFKHDIPLTYPEFTLFIHDCDMIAEELYNNFGQILNIAWADYKWNNEDTRGAILSILRAYFYTGNEEMYGPALAALNGISVTNRASVVEGMFESYEYKITDIGVGTITVERPSTLLPLTWALSGLEAAYIPRFMVMKNNAPVYFDITGVSNNVLSVTGDLSQIAINDIGYIELINKFAFDRVIAEAVSLKFEFESDIAFKSSDGTAEFFASLKKFYDQAGVDRKVRYERVIDEEQSIENVCELLPRIIIKDSPGTVNGVFHLTDIYITSGKTRFKSVAPSRSSYLSYWSIKVPYPYNDHIDVSDPNANIDTSGILYLYWPTHKFILLRQKDPDGNAIYQRINIDAPLDSSFGKNDEIPEFKNIVNNIDVLMRLTFPGWNEFNTLRGPDTDPKTGYVEALNYDYRFPFGSYLLNFSDVTVEIAGL